MADHHRLALFLPSIQAKQTFNERYTFVYIRSCAVAFLAAAQWVTGIWLFTYFKILFSACFLYMELPHIDRHPHPVTRKTLSSQHVTGAHYNYKSTSRVGRSV
jgi:hypothetical protein